VIDRLHNIQATTLLINGRYDEVHDMAVEPFFQHIPKVRWVQFADSAHVPQLEETERFMQVVWAFLHGYSDWTYRSSVKEMVMDCAVYDTSRL
jgi:L-proline amide hydrolase